MHCPKCQTAVSELHRFCSQCGGPLAQPSRLPPAGVLDQERKHVTIMFADLKGSLALLAARDPEDARRLLLSVLDVLIGEARDAGGTVNQVMGDGIMAIFGAPAADEHHALHACFAALRMHEAIARLDREGLCPQGEPLLIRVGMNSGEVVVGMRGDGFDAQYTAFGEVAHVAARLENLARPGRSLMTAGTFTLVSDSMVAEPLEPVSVRGLSQPLQVYELRGVQPGRVARRSSFEKTPFVGRVEELNVIRRSLARASTGQGHVVLLSGEPGVGKSRLITECLGSARRQGCLILHSGGPPYPTRVSYLAVRDALRSYLSLRSEDDEATRRSALIRRVREHEAPPQFAEAALLGLFGLSDASWDATPPPLRRRRIIQVLIWLTLAESRRQPVIWVVEDMQWADGETEAFLSSLMREIVDARVLVLLDHRPEYRPGELAREDSVRMDIGRLDGGALDLLLDGVLGTDPSLGPVRRLLAQRTGGNPFFVEESIRMLVEAGAIIGGRGEYRRVAMVLDLLPTNVQAILAARMDRLNAEAKRLLQAAALIGQQVNAVVLQRLVSLSAADLDRHVTELRDAGFLKHPASRDETGYAFVHALSHEVAYRGMLQDTRCALHARVVEILEAMYAEQLAEHVEVLGWHALRGRQWAKAVRYLREAGGKALRHSACEAAVAHFEQALEGLAQLPADHDRARVAYDVKLDLRNALFPLARHREMLACLTGAKALAETLADVSRQARAAAHLCHCYWLNGNWADAVATGAEALALSKRIGEVGIQVWSRFYQALAHYSQGELASAVLLLQANSALLQAELSTERFGGFSLPAVVGADWLAWCLAEQGNFSPALQHASAGLALARQAGQPFDRVHGLLGVGGVHVLQGDATQAIPLLQDAVDICDARELVSVRPRVASSLALAWALAGRCDDAISLARQAVRHSLDMRHGVLSTLCQHRNAEVLLLCGRYGDGLLQARTALELCRRTRERGLEAATMRLLGDAQAAHGAPDDALASLQAARRLANQLGMRPLEAHCRLGIARLARARGVAADEHDARIAAAASFDELGMAFWAERARNGL